MKYIDEHYYHVYNRGAHKQNIFFEEANYLHLTKLFEKYSRQYKICIMAYCLMPNHYHLIIKQYPSGSISQFLKTTFNAYTQAINKRYVHSGTIFQGQAKIKHIETDEYCMHVIRYVHRNPISAKLISDIKEWQYSDYLNWIGKRTGEVCGSELRNSYFNSPYNYETFVTTYDESIRQKDLGKYLFDE